MMPKGPASDGIEKATELKPGQIRYLYFWVHPQWNSASTHGGVDIEIAEYKAFVDRLRESPRVGLVQVADRPREEFMENDVYAGFVRKLWEFDKWIKGVLRDRYLVWDRGRFVNARDPESVRTLVERFSLLQRDQSDYVLEREKWMTKDPKYLAKITVFGKERDTCPLGQATLWDLHNLASIVRYLSHETPGAIIPPTRLNLFPGDGDASYIFKR